MTLTPNGRGLGRLSPKPDRLSRDFLYAAAHESAAQRPTLPGSVNLWGQLPPAFDQGQTSACGGCAGAALMSFLFHPIVFSPLQVYYATRVLESAADQDGGVETRDVLKALQQVGAVPELDWPFDPSKVLTPAPAPVAPGHKIASYAQLVGVSDYLACLARGFPFILGFMVPESLDGEFVEKHGVLPKPDLSKELILGGHDVLVIGYANNFRESPRFKTSGLAPELVDDTMLLVRNSWGKDWGIEGHFWMPISYAVSPTTGGDAWTARTTAALAAADLPVNRVVAPPTPIPVATQRQKDACFNFFRNYLDTHTSYGGWVSDSVLRPATDGAAIKVVQAV